MIFLKKIHGNIFSSNFLKRWSFQKGWHWDMILLVLSEKMVFFPENIIFFFWAVNERLASLGNTWKNDIFCVHIGVLQTWCHTSLSKKESKTVLSCKNIPKGD